ncbi:uncharacterized protein LOC143034084 [Oratosquilla oratoria]|uniref:uncharacterized protein LOC143034084 n=1 Tax=Oratosquilla oratoria TaxID=337810 RepID=UPI003F75A3A0
MTRRQTEDMLVRLESFIRICCDINGFRRGQASSEPILHRDVDEELINNHRTVEYSRFTILPTISVVPAWEGKEEHSRFNLRKHVSDGLTTHVWPYQFADDFRYSYDETTAEVPRLRDVIVPTSPTRLPPPTISWQQQQRGESELEGGVAHAVDDVSKGFLDAFSSLMKARKVGENSENIPSLRQEEVRGGEAVVGGAPPHVQEGGALVTLQQSEGLSPVLQACIGLGVLVVVMVILFHLHHFRRDCMVERRVLGRRSRLRRCDRRTHHPSGGSGRGAAAAAATKKENEDVESKVSEEEIVEESDSSADNSVRQEGAKPKRERSTVDRIYVEAVVDDVTL